MSAATLSASTSPASRIARPIGPVRAPCTSARVGVKRTWTCCMPVCCARILRRVALLSRSAWVSASVRWISSRSDISRLTDLFASMARRLSRNSVRLRMWASTSTTSAVLSSLVVSCCTTCATPARPPSSLSTSAGRTRISSEAAPACCAVSRCRDDDSSSQRSVPQSSRTLAQASGSLSGATSTLRSWRTARKRSAGASAAESSRARARSAGAAAPPASLALAGASASACGTS